jgi:ABC-type transport system substrate-binding protein
MATRNKTPEAQTLAREGREQRDPASPENALDPTLGIVAVLLRGITAVSIIVGLLLNGGCGNRSSEDSSDHQTMASGSAGNGVPKSGGILRLALQSPTSLDPALTDDVYEATVVNQIFSGLVQLDANLNVLPDLAQSWAISRDRLVFLFKLRKDAHFHNGRHVTAEDFIYSFTRLLDESQVPPGIIQDYLDKIDGVDDFIAGKTDHIRGLVAKDPYTLEISLARPYASFLAVLSMDQAKVLPREEVERKGTEGFGREPVGSGPFRLISWDPEKSVCLVANRDYFGEQPHLDTLLFVHDPGSNQDWRKPAFLAGELDAIEIREEELAEILSQGEYRVMRRPELSLEFMGFNVTHPVFKDVRVRRAVAMAIDRHALKKIAGKGFDIPAGLLPPGIPGYSPKSKVLPHDPERARRLLAEAGFDEAHPLSLPLTTVSRSAYAVARDSVVTASLAEVGIQVDLQEATWVELDRAIDERTAGSFQISWIADLPDPDSFLYSLFVSGGASNLFAYSNSAVDSLLEAGGHDPDQVARLVRYREAERLILEDAPLVPLFNVIALFVVQPDVRGVELSPFGICSVPMERIWFDRTRGGLRAGL